MIRLPLSVTYSVPARADIDGIYRHIAQDNSSVARDVVAAIDDAVILLSRFPHKSRRTKRRGMRALILSDYPYIIFFTIKRREIEVLHVMHGARRHPGFQEEAFAFVR
jgi:plasmid stabilization system protein ParE